MPYWQFLCCCYLKPLCYAMQPSTLQQLMSNEQLMPLPKYDEAFYLYSFKITPCSNTLSHNWSLCPFVHAKEKARRRDPRVFSYQPLPCPEDRKGTNCPQGDQCPYTHNVYEYWLHPQRFRTQMCQQGSACTRPLCFFAHSLEELRVVDQQSNTVVSAAQVAPAAGCVATVHAAVAAPGMARNTCVPSMAVVAGVQGPGPAAALVHPAPGVVHVQQPSMQQQPAIQQIGNPGTQLFNPQPAIVAYRPAAQRPSLQQPPIQDAATQQPQIVPVDNLQQPALQQLQLQQVQAIPGTSSSHLQQQQQQVPFGLAAAAPVQQPQHFAVQQQWSGSQHSWQPQPMYAQPHAQQQLHQGTAASRQTLSSSSVTASHIQGMAAPVPQQPMQMQILQQPQHLWLQPQHQMALGSNVARPQIVHLSPGGQVLPQPGAALNGLGPGEDVQALMQQMSLLDDTNPQG